jgi:hypothetical protein
MTIIGIIFIVIETIILIIGYNIDYVKLNLNCNILNKLLYYTL